MPKHWLYLFILPLPLFFSLLLLYTPFLSWLWYNDHQDTYYMLSPLTVQPYFKALIGGWPMPVFVCTVYVYWLTDDGENDFDMQFMLLPLVYIPFAIIGTALATRSFDPSTLYAYPVLIIFFGYLYILPWSFCLWIFDKLHIVIT